MPSIERMISIEFRDPAHQLSKNILGSYLWKYSKTCLKRPLKNRQKQRSYLKTNGCLMEVKSIAFCNTFDLH